MLTFSVFERRHDNRPKPREGWDAFVADVTHIRVVADKHSVPLYSPAVYLEGTTRSKANVLHCSFVCMDIDSATEEQVMAALDALDGVALVVHTTHSHVDGLKHGLFKCRVIVQCSRAIEMDEWDRIWWWLFEQTGSILDKACRHQAAMYYFPSCAEGHEMYSFARYVDGVPLDVDGVLKVAPPVAEPSTLGAPTAEALAAIETSVRYQLCEAFLDRYPETSTFKAAQKLGDFGLKPEEGWPLLQRFASRLPWVVPENELRERLEHAYRYRDHLPFGWRLVDTDRTDRVTRADVERWAKKIEDSRLGRLLRQALNNDPPLGWEQLMEIADALGKRFRNADTTLLAHEFADAITASRTAGHRDADEAAFARAITQTQADLNNDDVQKLADLIDVQRDSIREAFGHVGVERDQPYTRAELRQYAEDAGVDSLRSRWIIYRDNAVYFLVAGEYVGPYTADEACVHAHRLLAPAGLTLHKVLKNGDSRALTLKEMTESYGTVADGTIASFLVQRSYFDAKEHMIVEAAAPLRPIEPAYNAAVEGWLAALSEDSHAVDKILDWLACVTKLSQPCAALALIGEGGVGKSLFAHGLSRLWTDGGPTEIDDVAGNFNASLARCPLVFADEDVPRDSRGEPRTQLLRRLVQEHTRSYKRKFLPEAKLVGSLRLVIAANNAEMLVNDRLNVTDADVRAIAERFVYVPITTTRARSYIEGLSTEVRDEIEHGTAIAAHALWLRDRRNVRRGFRFLVEGEAGSDLEMLLTTSAGLRTDVCYWLASWCLNPDKISKVGERPLVINRELLVSSRILHTHWRTYCERDAALGSIERALGGVSSGRREIEDAKYRVVDMRRLAWWADRVGLHGLGAALVRLGLGLQVVASS